VTARLHDQQYDWTTTELAALKDGLESATVDVVRNNRPVSGLAEKEAALIQLGREIFTKHTVSTATYSRALKAFGERDLVDLVGVMAQHASDAALLTAFDQRLPTDQKPLLSTR
jgi:hypothetical protein